ncbi:MAG: hypothetical protein V1725_06700 [archaeon]
MEDPNGESVDENKRRVVQLDDIALLLFLDYEARFVKKSKEGQCLPGKDYIPCLVCKAKIPPYRAIVSSEEYYCPVCEHEWMY